MPLFEGHKDKGIERYFIELPDAAKAVVAWKYPDQQIRKFTTVNVDLDYVAVFTNLGSVIGVLGPGRHQLEQGATPGVGFLVDHLTGDAWYDAEVFFITTRDITGIPFGGAVDAVTDGPTGLVVALRVFGELAYHIVGADKLLAKLIGTGNITDYSTAIAAWAVEQAEAAIRIVTPDLVATHGVLAMGQLQEATSDAALAKANAKLATYGLEITTFAELNVNVPPEDLTQIKQLAASTAYGAKAGSFTEGVRSAATLEIAQGVQEGHVGSGPAVMAGMMMGNPIVAPAGGGGAAAPAPVAPTAATAPAATAPAATAPAAAAGVDPAANFCDKCGAHLHADSKFCPGCGAPLSEA